MKITQDEITQDEINAVELDHIIVVIDKIGNWRIRQKLGSLAERLDESVAPLSRLLDDRRYRDAADFALCTYEDAKEFVAFFEQSFKPQTSEDK